MSFCPVLQQALLSKCTRFAQRIAAAAAALCGGFLHHTLYGQERSWGASPPHALLHGTVTALLQQAVMAAQGTDASCVAFRQLQG